MRDYPALMAKAALGCLGIALLLVIFYAVAPALIGENASVMGILPVISMLLVVLAGLLAVGFCLALIYEIATAKNGGQWKVIWIILIIVFGFVGAAIYMYGARKERKT